LYSEVEKNDDKEDVPFSILKNGAIWWKKRVFNKLKKEVATEVKAIVKKLFKEIKKEIALSMMSEEEKDDSDEDFEQEKIEIQKRK